MATNNAILSRRLAETAGTETQATPGLRPGVGDRPFTGQPAQPGPLLSELVKRQATCWGL